MRTLLLTALLGGAVVAAHAQQRGGYRSPRRLHTVNSQQGYRRPPLCFSLGVNTAYYNGDITSKFGNNSYRIGGDIGVTQAISPRVTLGLEFTYFQLKARDSQADRGLRFTSDNYMLVPFFRYNLIADRSMYLGVGQRAQDLQVYLEAGVGAIRYNPKAYQEANGPLALVPESKGGYPATAGVLPVGLGFTYRMSKGTFISLEGLYYFSSTDLLDDVSQRGNSKSLDGFAVANLKFEFNFPTSHGKPLVHFD